MKERLREALIKEDARFGKAIWWVGEHVIRFRFKGKESLAQTQEHLEKGGSALLISNHASFPDLGLAWEIAKKHLLPALQGHEPPVPAFFSSLKHLDSRRKITSRVQSFIMRSAAAAEGFYLLPTVQEYDRESYPDFVSINLSTIRQALKLLNTAGGIVFIAPEETRSKTGALQEAKEGIGVIFSSKTAQEKTLAVPIGVVSSHKFHKSGRLWVNPFAKIRVLIGKPFSYQEVEDEAREKLGLLGKLEEVEKLNLKDELKNNKRRQIKQNLIGTAMMIRLAQLLPPEQRGFYAKFFTSK